MANLAIRIFIAAVIASLLSSFGITGNPAMLQTVFAVLGILFSISMSLLVSFNLSKVLNEKIRQVLRRSITKTRNAMSLDFFAATCITGIALVWDNEHTRFIITDWLTFDIVFFAVLAVVLSLVYEIYNFKALHKLHTDIEEAIIKEETNRSNRG